MRTLLTICLCLTLLTLFTITLSAQRTEEFYSWSFKPTTDYGRYYVVTEAKDGKWYREAFYLPEKTQAMKGTYLDPACTIADGEIIWFHTNRNLKSQTGYTNGKRNGKSEKYHDNGMKSDSAFYVNGLRQGIGLGWDSNGYQIDSSNFDGYGNGVQVHWYPDGGSVSSTGFWMNDTVMTKRWTYYHTNGKINAITEYDNGKEKSYKCFDLNGIELPADLCINREASFSNDKSAWSRYLEKNLRSDVPVRNKAPLGAYTVYISFVVEKDGTLSDITPKTSYGYGMEQEVIRLLKKSSKWVPAYQHGKNVRAYRLQPVTFMVTN